LQCNAGLKSAQPSLPEPNHRKLLLFSGSWLVTDRSCSVICFSSCICHC